MPLLLQRKQTGFVSSHFNYRSREHSESTAYGYPALPSSPCKPRTHCATSSRRRALLLTTSNRSYVVRREARLVMESSSIAIRQT
jgi:hypothetical protein